MKNDNDENNDSVNDLNPKYGRIHVFNSFEEQENFLLNEMASLSSHEILLHLRRFINIAYGMHGYDPKKLPSKHIIKNIKYLNE